MAQRQWRSDDTDQWLEAFGDGSDGNTYIIPANEGCSASISTKTITLATAGGFTDGMLVLIHQTRGTGAGTWELNKILSGGTTTTLTMKYDTMNTYTDSGASQAQIIELKQYNGMTTGTKTVPDWDGSKGGLLAWLDKTTLTIDGTLTLIGAAGVSNGTSSAAGGAIYGFSGGTGSVGNGTAQSGEGTASDVATTQDPAGNAGGGGLSTGVSNRAGAGGGGGHGSAGTDGAYIDIADKGIGGDASGTASLVTMTPGGAGGGGRNWQSESLAVGGGGAGGAMAFIFAKNIVITGNITLTGGAGGSGYTGGGGGAGGACLLKCETATLGTTKIVSNGGSGNGGRSGGNGGVGRIHIDYSDSFTGTTTPTIDSTLDTTIIVSIISVSSNYAYFM